jgi:hypothetical protein
VISLNDLVDEIHRELYPNNEEYVRFLEAVCNEASMEGWLVLDDAKAVEIIKDYAMCQGPKYLPVYNEKTAAVIKAARVVWRRYGMDRVTRANMIGGQVVLGLGNEE